MSRKCLHSFNNIHWDQGQVIRILGMGEGRKFETSVISVTQSYLTLLKPHGLQHTRLLCPSPTPGGCSNSCPSSWWCHPNISSSLILCLLLLPSIFPTSGSFPISQFFTSGRQTIVVSAAASILPMNTEDWSPLGWMGWISLQSKGLSRVFSNTMVQKHQFFSAQLSFYSPTLTSIPKCGKKP